MLKALAFTALSLATGAAAADSPSRAGEPAFRAIYKELVETDTTLSNGSCTLAAERMAARLKSAGIGQVQVFTAPGHPKEGGLFAVYPGSDAKARAILLLAHIDVVEAKREDWTRDPFVLVEENGSFYARGAVDDKAESAIWVDTMIRYAHEKFTPRRAIKLALTCGEETSRRVQRRGVAREESPRLDRRRVRDQRRRLGRDGCAGQPPRDERAGRREGFAEFPPRGHEHRRPQLAARQGKRYLPAGRRAVAHRGVRIPGAVHGREPRVLCRHGEDPGRARQRADGARDESAGQGSARCRGHRRVSARDPSWNATMRTTCVATTLEAGHATNALPQRARANVNCRIFPGVPGEDVRAQLEKLVADPEVTVTTLEVRGPAHRRRRSPPGSWGRSRSSTRNIFPAFPCCPSCNPARPMGSS